MSEHVELLAVLEQAGQDLHVFHPRGPFGECTIETCARIRAVLDRLVPPGVDEHLEEKYCDADLLLPHGGKLSCHIKGIPHAEPHWCPSDVPCSACGGMDLHAGWCPLLGETTNEFADVRFDDDGWYWVGDRP